MNRSQENISFWQNASFDGNQTQQEFPQWKPIISLLVLGYWLLSVLPTTLMNSSVLLALKKSSINKALVIVHIFMLAMNIVTKMCSAVAITTYIPSIIRFCVCSIAASSVPFFLHIFTVCYQPLVFLSLTLLQLLIIMGKRKLVNHKTVGVTVIVITVLAILIPLVFTIVSIRDGETFLCSGVCPGATTSHFIRLFISYLIAFWIPSLSTITILTTWTCIIFKHNYAGGDVELTRRMVAVPLMMPIIITITTILTFGLFRATDLIQTVQTRPFGVYTQNWIASIKVLVLLLNEITNGLSYPCLILFLYPKLLKSWKVLPKFKMCYFAVWKHNKVIPDQHIHHNTSSKL